MSVSIVANRLSDWDLGHDFQSHVVLAAETALQARGPREGEVSVTFVTAADIRSLNREYLGHDRPTDVIAFDLGDEKALIGDVYVCPEVAADNASERGEELRTELLRLVIHGSLHLIGLDHPEGSGRESSPMFTLQEELLRALTAD
jgi:probable rRNA maturation factor